jgi:hypothetical protein
MFKIILVMKNNKHHFYIDVVKKLSFFKFPHAVFQSFLSEETMATAEVDAIYRVKW